MDPGELEGIALALYNEIGEDPERPPSAFRLARAVPGVGPVERPRNMIGPAVTFQVAGKDRIAVKASIPLEYAHFYVGHELGHILLRRNGLACGGEREERAADYLGAALLMPRAAVRAVYRAEGFAPAALAEIIVCTQTAAVLRLGEVVGTPLAAISPALVRVRGPETWIWPDEVTIRRWASGRSRPGLAKVRLTDQPRRVALVGDEDFSETG